MTEDQLEALCTLMRMIAIEEILRMSNQQCVPSFVRDAKQNVREVFQIKE